MRIKKTAMSKTVLFDIPLSSSNFYAWTCHPPPFVSIVETAESFMAIQTSSFETPILIREDPTRKRFSKKFLIVSQ